MGPRLVMVEWRFTTVVAGEPSAMTSGTHGKPGEHVMRLSYMYVLDLPHLHICDTLKPVLGNHSCERAPISKDQAFLAEEPSF